MRTYKHKASRLRAAKLNRLIVFQLFPHYSRDQCNCPIPSVHSRGVVQAPCQTVRLAGCYHLQGPEHKTSRCSVKLERENSQPYQFYISTSAGHHIRDEHSCAHARKQAFPSWPPTHTPTPTKGSLHLPTTTNSACNCNLHTFPAWKHHGYDFETDKIIKRAASTSNGVATATYQPRNVAMAWHHLTDDHRCHACAPFATSAE